MGDTSPTKKDMKAKSGCLMSDLRLDLRCEARGIAHRLGKIWIFIDPLDEGFLVVVGAPIEKSQSDASLYLSKSGASLSYSTMGSSFWAPLSTKMNS